MVILVMANTTTNQSRLTADEWKVYQDAAIDEFKRDIGGFTDETLIKFCELMQQNPDLFPMAIQTALSEEHYIRENYGTMGL
jgi:hypothetical protein